MWRLDRACCRGGGGERTGVCEVGVIVVVVGDGTGLLLVELGIFDFFQLDHNEDLLMKVGESDWVRFEWVSSVCGSW